MPIPQTLNHLSLTHQPMVYVLPDLRMRVAHMGAMTGKQQTNLQLKQLLQ
jgi:hypothetical protein